MSKYLDTRTEDGELPAFRRSGIDCAEASDLIPALALGAIDTGERFAVQLHCQACPDCTRLLDASRHVVDYLPFSAPGIAPPDQAKHALFARIADAQPASAASAPTLATITPIDSPVIDSPASKSRGAPAAETATLPLKAPDVHSWSLPGLSSRAGRLVAGPLALALVLVTLYSLQSFDVPFVNDAVDPTPETGLAADANAALGESSTAPDDTDYTVDTFDTFDTRGASAAGPFLQQYANNTSGMFVYKSVSTGQTELLGTVAPNFADCSVVETEPGAYTLTVSGVHLPGGSGTAGVYLVTDEGARIYVTDVMIDARGDGKVTFETERPLDAFRALEIGMARQTIGAAVSDPLYHSVIFSLSTSEVLRGLALAS